MPNGAQGARLSGGAAVDWQAGVLPAGLAAERVGALAAPVRARIAGGLARGADLLGVIGVLGRPVAAGWVAPQPDGAGEIVSFAVAPALRRQGLGRELLARLEAHARSCGLRTLDVQFSERSAHLAAARALLRTAGWDEPQPGFLACSSSGGLAGASWVRHARPPAGWRAASWASLSAPLRLRVQALGRTCASSGLDVRPAHPLFSPDGTCVLVREGGEEVGGWMVVHDLGHGARRYAALWVRPELRGGSAAAALLSCAILRHHATGEATAGHWVVAAGNRAMQAFHARYLARFTDRQTQHLRARKQVSSARP